MQEPARLGWGSNNLTIWGEGFSFQHFSVVFWNVHAGALLSQMSSLNLASNLFAWTAWVSKCSTSYLSLGYTFWCSISTPELLLWLHQALFIVSGVCLSSFIHHLFLLITFLRERFSSVMSSRCVCSVLKVRLFCPQGTFLTAFAWIVCMGSRV